MDSSWPLPPGPALTIPYQPPKSQFKKKKLPKAVRRANEDYHDFIESVGRTTSKSPEQATNQRQEQRLVVGTTRLYDKRGRLRLIPVPSANPKDPLNFPLWKKWTVIGAVSMLGALAVATESALGSPLLPVYALDFAGVSPSGLKNIPLSSSVSVAETAQLEAIVKPLLSNLSDVAIPWTRIRHLATLPLLTSAVAGYIQTPLSATIGRRPVLLLTGILTWTGALWAGLSSFPFSSSASSSSPSSSSSSPSSLSSSSNLGQLLAARALIGFGAGSANALLPLVAAHDLVFLHQRHIALAVLVSSQAAALAILYGVAPHLVVERGLNWRVLYLILAVLLFLSWLVMVVSVPETWKPDRSRTQLCGGGPPVYADNPQQKQQKKRPLDFGYGSRSWKSDMAFLNPIWSALEPSLMDLVRTAILPPVLWTATVQTNFLVAHRAMEQLTAATMLTQNASYALTGLGASSIPMLAAGVAAAVLGPIAGRSAFALAQRRRHRQAEHNLPGLAGFLLLALTGIFLFGAAGQNASSWGWGALVAAHSMLALALLVFLAGSSVYLIESFPVWAGACLAHANGLRYVAAFFTDDRTSAAIRQRRLSFLGAWSIYGEVLLVLGGLGLPSLFVFGKRLRCWAAGTVNGGSFWEEDENKPSNSRTHSPAYMPPLGYNTNQITGRAL